MRVPKLDPSHPVCDIRPQDSWSSECSCAATPSSLFKQSAGKPAFARSWFSICNTDALALSRLSLDVRKSGSSLELQLAQAIPGGRASLKLARVMLSTNSIDQETEKLPGASSRVYVYEFPGIRGLHSDGTVKGTLVGGLVGNLEGFGVGDSDGESVGLCVGAAVGLPVGSLVKSAVG